ncbi:chemotaxis protein CheR [Abyssibacter profundi]|uniref:Chemotaxis protein methyltransferase n=1 Tax=Abyssibacter profundi TaxID=2182787 RepID=A0A363ULL9_9GAMM|nr:chemotaxis protein CheR [Abyssibacter profundi]
MPSRSKPTGLQSRPDAVAAISVAVAGMQQPAPLSASGFEAIATFLRRHAGIELNQDKHSLVQSRLRKHVVAGGFSSYDRYVEHTLKVQGSALITLIDALTTNKTAFFREADHFRFLESDWLPDACERPGLSRPLRIWSAGCSAGHEPYTLSMVLNEAASRTPGLRFEILATDLCTTVLRTAAAGIYSQVDVAPVPDDLRRKYLLRGRDAEDTRVAMGPELRAAVTFKRFNLVSDPYAFEAPFDLIMCRNVMIYFSNATREAVISRMHDVMAPGAHLIVGHSESFSGIRTPLRYVAPTIYQRPLENPS